MRQPRLFTTFAAAIACASIPLQSGFAEQEYAPVVSVKPLLKSSSDAAGQPIVYPHSGTAEITGVQVEIPVGQKTGWHIHPSPCVAYVLEGEVMVEIENGTKVNYKAGDSFAEVVNLRHCGHNTGSIPAKILMFVIGERGVPISKMLPPP
jgi:quercetin dioxygenase-like cupin family protein